MTVVEPVMRVIPAGRFRMGDLSGRCYDETSLPWHEVVVPVPFALACHPVTVVEYRRLVATPPRPEWRNDRHPVVAVSWHDAQRYLAWLNRKAGIAADSPHRYRLPTEAEWEYACRAGSVADYGWGDGITPAQAHYDGDGRPSGPATVDAYAANPWGLQQMHGNVWEWCEDVFSPDAYVESRHVYPRALGRKEAGEGMNGPRLIRGGSWREPPVRLKAAIRAGLPAATMADDVGFRIARSLPPGQHHASQPQRPPANVRPLAF